jgi:hypothetical protein
MQADLQQHSLEEARLEQNAVQTGVGLQAGDLPTARLQQVCQVSMVLYDFQCRKFLPGSALLQR